MNSKVKPFLFLPLIMLSACASKQDLVVVADDLRKLKTDSETIKVQSAGSYSDIQLVRDEVARLQGRVEERDFKNKQAFARLGVEDSLLVHKLDKVDDMELRLERIEEYLGLTRKVDAAVVPTSAEALSDAGLLKEGLDKFTKKDYTSARESFSSLLKSFPKSGLADNAQFQIAESYFNEKKYEDAILEYQKVIAKYTKSGRRSAALYKQAISLEKIGDVVNSKLRFKTLIDVYPASPEATLARKKLK